MGALHMGAYGLHMKGGSPGDDVYLLYLKCMAHGCMKGAHDCITHECVTQGCQELGVRTGVYLEFLKWCLKFVQKVEYTPDSDT